MTGTELSSVRSNRIKLPGLIILVPLMEPRLILICSDLSITCQPLTSIALLEIFFSSIHSSLALLVVPIQAISLIIRFWREGDWLVIKEHCLEVIEEELRAGSSWFGSVCGLFISKSSCC